MLSGSGHYVPALAGTGVVLVTNTLLRSVSQAINATPVSNADLVREYQITVICLASDEVHIRTLLSNSMYAKPLSFQSLTSEDVPDQPDRLKVTDTEAASEGSAEARADREPDEHGEEHFQRELDREGSGADDGVSGLAAAACRAAAFTPCQGVSINPAEMALTTA